MLKSVKNFIAIILLLLLFGFSSSGQSCSVSVIPPSIHNGVNVTGGTISGSTSLTSNPSSGCSILAPPNSSFMGTAGPFVYEFNFSQPVNNLIITILHTGVTANEEFTFTSNLSSPPTIIDLGSCTTTIVANTIISGLGAGPGGGGGTFEIHSATGPFTQLQIAGTGGAGGSIVTLCSSSVIPTPPDITANNITCADSCNGSAEVLLSNNPPYTYLWSTGDTTAIIDSLCPATYTCIVTDANGVIDTLSISLENPPPIVIDSEIITNPSCNGYNDASYIINASGGTGDLSYSLNSTNSDIGSFSNLTADTFLLSITDEENCLLTDSVIIVEPAPIQIQVIDSSSTTCNANSDGFIEVAAMGGNGSYEFFLDGISNGNNGLFQNLNANSYQIHVEDNLACSDTLDVVLSTLFNENFNIQVNPESCYNSCNGEIIINSASTSNLHYSIDNCTTTSTNNNFSNLCPNDYIICISDAFNCTFTDTVNLAPGPLNEQPDLQAISDLCLNDNPVPIQAANIGILSGSIGISGNNFDPSIAGVGNHQIINTTNSSCNTADTIYVMVNAIPDVNFDANDSLFCEGEILELNYLGSPAQIYSWEFNNQTISSIANPQFALPNAGVFDVSLSVTDQNNCSNYMDKIQWIEVVESVFADFDYTIDNYNNQINLTNTSTGANQYLWYFDDGSNTTLMNPNYQYPEASNYTSISLYAYNTLCHDSITKHVEIPPSVFIYVPNTFTPNGDQSNNNFKPIISGVDNYNYKLKIFNRWGEMIFQTSSTDTAWDGTYNGKLVPEGTYTWEIELAILNNTNRLVKRGHITILK